MIYDLSLFVRAVLCASIIAAAAAPAMAQPAVTHSSAISGTSIQQTNVEQIQYRNGGRYRNGYRNRGGNGGNIALGIGAAIIGGIVLSEAARAEHRSSHGSDWNRCAQTYRSFDSDTGTYTGYDGVRRTCPFLR
jgi:opacity protein-like surface antigen